MATKPEQNTSVDVVKDQKSIKEQDNQVSNKMPPPNEIPAGNPKEHPVRQNR